jgi:urea carboxylase-associated protein 1
MTSADVIDGTIHEDLVVAPGQPWSGTLSKGEILRIVDLEGRQAVDLICFNAHATEEAYDSTVTLRIAKSIFLGKGMKLYSGKCNPILTIEEDTVGHHDTMCGCCSEEINMLRYGVPNTPSCKANLLSELAKHRLDGRSLVPNVNFFMYVPVDVEGNIEFKLGLSKPGDFVDLRAEMDALVVLSNCPQMLNPANGYKLTPVRLVRYSKRGDA